ncbi:Uncharacterized conserved protein, DUF58 family, contains vWF domain [Halobiforma haloterrestris]|uniref:Uncharacterized conserved protein, DUF58 family, contains vWF domain n=1 Tax=Natronobacterium haloterrestre TaxID=148448 RepID=A0A1I1JSX1_NATHA|nr:DUF58 domain-containing protein [Halobiforma haloterrestris]SFC51321.1 Uncharacterized conserved protein, DUF58 family, contains vWF domain [Halobiforma haloterrestris]
MNSGRVTRWHSGVVASVVLIATGTLFGSTPLLLAAIVPLTYLGYAALSSVPDPATAVTVDRDCTPQKPLPGEQVEVTLTIRNESARTLPDVRIIDRGPENLEVIDGAAKDAVTLRSGEETKLTYTLQPRRGTYVFDDTWIRLRSLSATAVATGSVAADGDSKIECTVPLDGLPIHRDTIPVTGSVGSDRGGAGYEFHSTREYQQGDPLSRIDWRRYARTGDLGTVLYREQETTNVIVIVDGRTDAGVAPAPGRPDGLTLAAYAGLVASSAVIDVGHNVGVVGLGIRGETPGVYEGPPAYVEPGSGVNVGARIARVCDAIAARGSGAELSSSARGAPEGDAPDDGARSPADGNRTVRADGGGASTQSTMASVSRLDALFPASAQLVVCTPAVDDEIIDFAVQLRRRGYPLSVVSPNVTGRDDVGARLARIRRQSRLERLRRLDVPVADWDPETSLVSALSHGFGEVIR